MEVSALALHLVQAAIGYLNTVLIQIVLADPLWRERLTAIDRRGLSALFWSHLNLYGRLEVDLDPTSRPGRSQRVLSTPHGPAAMTAGPRNGRGRTPLARAWSGHGCRGEGPAARDR